MRFHPKAALVLVAFLAVVSMATSRGGAWLYLAEAGATALILAGVAGLLRERRTGARRAASERQLP